MKNLLRTLSRLSCIPVFVLFTFPASLNYELKSYDFGAGGGTGGSTNYLMEEHSGEAAGAQSSTSYSIGGGLAFTEQANVPNAPTLENTDNWYNKLHFVVNTGGNPTDTVYAIAISTDNFATTNYIKSDNTIGGTLTLSDYQTYAAWGGSSGAYVIGLAQNTTYKIKVKAMQGRFTESGWGPVATAATVGSTLSFDIDIGTTGGGDPGSTSSPYTVAFSSVNPGSVAIAGNNVWVSLSTNGSNGGFVYVYDQYGGLRSALNNYTITSATADLSAVQEGFGIQSTSATQSSGGPMSAQSPYNGASNNVGVVDTTIRPLYTTSNSPVSAGRVSFSLMTKAKSTTPASNDYADILTIISSASF